MKKQDITINATAFSNPRKYTKLREAIIKANPSILDLKFGCEVELKKPFMYRDSLAPFKYTKVIDYIKSEDRIFIDGVQKIIEIKQEDIKEIIGRPITIDDTALVVKDKHYLIDNWKLGSLDKQEPKLIDWILENLK